MKSVIKKLVSLAALAGALGVSSSFALPTALVNDGPGSPGGVFNVVSTADGVFQSFCLEIDESIVLGGTYYYTISTAAKYNGTVSTPDPISMATAWLYRNYSSILGYNPASAADNNAVQQAFWFLENEGSFVGNAYSALAIAATGASWNNDANGAFGVFVMNLWANPDGTGPRQDVLIIPGVPEGGLPVALFGALLAGLAWARRKVAA